VHVVGGWDSILDGNNQMRLKLNELKTVEFDTRSAGPGIKCSVALCSSVVVGDLSAWELETHGKARDLVFPWIRQSFRPGNVRSREKVLFEAWERQIAEMAAGAVPRGARGPRHPSEISAPPPWPPRKFKIRRPLAKIFC